MNNTLSMEFLSKINGYCDCIADLLQGVDSFIQLEALVSLFLQLFSQVARVAEFRHNDFVIWVGISVVVLEDIGVMKLS